MGDAGAAHLVGGALGDRIVVAGDHGRGDAAGRLAHGVDDAAGEAPAVAVDLELQAQPPGRRRQVDHLGRFQGQARSADPGEIGAAGEVEGAGAGRGRRRIEQGDEAHRRPWPEHRVFLDRDPHPLGQKTRRQAADMGWGDQQPRAGGPTAGHVDHPALDRDPGQGRGDRPGQVEGLHLAGEQARGGEGEEQGHARRERRPAPTAQEQGGRPQPRCRGDQRPDQGLAPQAEIEPAAAAESDRTPQRPAVGLPLQLDRNPGREAARTRTR